MNTQQQRTEEKNQLASRDRVLVVDDDLNLCQTMQIVLEEEGFLVATAMDGVEALERIEQVHPSVMVLDMGLPLLDGEGVAKQLRLRYGNTIPVVLMTADGHVKEKGHRVGAIVALGKPFEIDDLVHAVYSALLARG